MYADRPRSSSLDPRSLGIAVALNGAAIAALLLAQPMITVIDHDRPLKTYPVPIDPPPPPLPPRLTKREPLHRQSPQAEKPIVDFHRTETLPIKVDLPPLGPVDPGPVTGPIATPTPALTFVAAEVDPAHLADLQPTYPAGELRAEHEGVVTVRVLIGADGRVHQVEQVSATSAAFFASTRDRALARWRFRPATRGGVPVEAWRTMTIRFVIPREG